MIPVDWKLQKKVIVGGLGVTGFQTALFLKTKGLEVTVFEESENEAVKDRGRELTRKGVQVFYKELNPLPLDTLDWAVVSPGFRPGSEFIRRLNQHKLPIFSEIEVASWFSEAKKVIAITGTAGKTSVTLMLSDVLRSSGFPVVTCGNIGNPWIGELSGITPNTYVVLEVSSFQLFFCHSFRPDIAVLTNLSENHEDWHGSMQDYIEAKLKIFDRQTKRDDAYFRAEDQSAFFSSKRFAATQIHSDQETTGMTQPEDWDANRKLVALLAGKLGCPENAIRETIRRFKAPEHRMERVAEINGIHYMNDSKSTTPASLVWALSQFPSKRVLLIAGGKAKTKKFQTVNALLKSKVKAAFVIGEASELLREIWKDHTRLEVAETLERALEKAVQCAEAGDVILLSPACASFDQYRSYEHRGGEFKRFVSRLEASVKIC